MKVFNRGDRVVRMSTEFDITWRRYCEPPNRVLTVDSCDGYVAHFIEVGNIWSPDLFELFVEPQPEPVAVTEPAVQQIPGVPDGYRLVRIGAPKKGEQYLDMNGGISAADCDWWKTNIPVIEPIVPPAPPTPIPSTVKVQLNRYLIGDLMGVSGQRVIECTAEYAGRTYSNYRLLGPSETLKLEVEV